MKTATANVTNQTGLHARPASQLVALAQKFESKISITADEKKIDPKSIISILAGGIRQGATVHIEAEGTDEDAAVTEIAAFIDALTE